MNQRGFSLTELVLVIAIISTLLVIATMNFSSMSKKQGVESAARELYVDIMKVRSEALFSKEPKTMVFSATGFSVYSSETLTSPVRTQRLKYSVTPVPQTVVFDGRGVGYFNGTADTAALCFQGGSGDAVADSIIMNKTMVRTGKLRTGTGCTSANVEIR